MCASLAKTVLFSRLLLPKCRIPMVSLVSRMGDVSDMRVPYRSSSDIFDIKNLASTDPFKQFDNWFNEACNTKGIAEANAMALGTCSKDGTPTVSMVLLKGYDEEGFRFFTNYESRKGRDLIENDRCVIMFYWEPLNRNIRIEGNAEKLPEQESMDYYHSRPRNSQIGVIISHKSYVIPDREVLYENFAKLQEEYKDEHKNIPKPSFWGGFRVKPRTFEFWQGQTNRLHDRIKFRKPKEVKKLIKKMLFEIAYLSLFHILSLQMVGGETTDTTSYLSLSGGDISDNCKLICNGGNVTIQIYNDRVSHICIGNSNAPCDWKMEQSDCFKGTAKRIRVLNTATSRFTCNGRLRMNNSCDIKMKCGRPGYTKRCDDCHDCFDKCKTSTSSCNVTFSSNGDSAIHITFNGLQVLQKREDNIDNICIDSEWSSWSWTQCRNKIWNQHRYRKCRYPAYFSSIKNCHLSESNYIQCINEDTLENRYTAFPCSWSPWGNCSTSSGTGIQNRTQSICSLSFQNISQCESTAIKMASLCQETHASSTTSWTSMHKKNGQNIIQRFRIDNCANKTINCRWVFYEQIENKSCERNPFVEEQQSSTANPVIGPVIGSVVVLVLVIGGVTVLILVIRRQKQKKDRTAQKTNAVPNATNNTQMDTNAYDDLSKRKSQHVYGIIDLTDQVEAEYSLVEESGIKKDHNNVSSDNYVVFQKEKAQETSEPQEINAEENYFILEKESAMKQSMQQQSDGGDNYLILEKESAMKQSMQQQSDGGDNYFILEKESAMKQSMQQQSDGGDNYFILEKKIAKTNSVK